MHPSKSEVEKAVKLWMDGYGMVVPCQSGIADSDGKCSKSSVCQYAGFRLPAEEPGKGGDK